MISKTIPKKCKKIKLIITDVDGVLTDGGIYYSEKGEEQRKFNHKSEIFIFSTHFEIPIIFTTPLKT